MGFGAKTLPLWLRKRRGRSKIVSHKVDGMGSGVPYSSEAQAVFDLLPGLTSDEKGHIATAVDDLVASGYWGDIDEIQIYGLQIESNALIGWKGLFNATKQGSPTHVPGDGFTIDFSTNFIHTNFANTAVQFTQNDGFIGIYCVENTDTSGTPRRLIASLGTSDAELNQEPASTRLRYALNSNTASIYAGESFFSNESYYELVRLSSAAQKLYKEGAEVATANATSVDKFQVNVNITYTGRVGAAVIGKASTINHVTFKNILQTLILGLRAATAILLTADSTLFTADSTLFTADATIFYI